jgi:hypothetical protein
MRLGVIGGIFGVNGQAHTEEEPPMALPQSAVSELLEAAVSELLEAIRAGMARV